MTDMSELQFKLLAAQIKATYTELEELRTQVQDLADALAHGKPDLAQTVFEKLETDAADRRATQKAVQNGPGPE